MQCYLELALAQQQFSMSKLSILDENKAASSFHSRELHWKLHTHTSSAFVPKYVFWVSTQRSI